MTVPNFVGVTNVTMDDIHTVVGGSSGTTVSLNDTDVRNHSFTHPEFNGGGLIQALVHKYQCHNLEVIRI